MNATICCSQRKLCMQRGLWFTNCDEYKKSANNYMISMCVMLYTNIQIKKQNFTTTLPVTAYLNP